MLNKYIEVVNDRSRDKCLSAPIMQQRVVYQRKILTMVFATAPPKAQRAPVKIGKARKICRNKRSDCHIAIQEAIQELQYLRTKILLHSSHGHLPLMGISYATMTESLQRRVRHIVNSSVQTRQNSPPSSLEVLYSQRVQRCTQIIENSVY